MTHAFPAAPPTGYEGALIFVLSVQVVAVGYALVGSLRARSLVGALAVLAILYGSLARGLALLPRWPQLPLGGALASHWAVFPVFVIGIAAVAFRRSLALERAEEDGSARGMAARQAGFAFLGILLLDAILLLVVGCAHLYVAMSVP